MLELNWAKESGSLKMQWAAFLNSTDVSQSKVTSGHSVVLTYSLRRTSYGIGGGACASAHSGRHDAFVVPEGRKRAF